MGWQALFAASLRPHAGRSLAARDSVPPAVQAVFRFGECMAQVRSRKSIRGRSRPAQMVTMQNSLLP